MSAELRPDLRALGCDAFDLYANSTARALKEVDFWGERRQVYANANLSVYSGHACEGSCRFCVEKLRPLSRGVRLGWQRRTEPDDAVYFGALREVLRAVKALDPSVSVTGGEPSRDPRLPGILAELRSAGMRKRTLTTNGSGLLRACEGGQVLDLVIGSGIRHVNISRPRVGDDDCVRLMGEESTVAARDLAEIVARCRARGVRPRLSCVLLRGEVDSFGAVEDYLGFARSVGVDNVVFRQLMTPDPGTSLRDDVVEYSEAARVELAPILEALSRDPRARFVKQVVGYYYYVEVWQLDGVDVVLERAELGGIARAQGRYPGVVHELVFHPNGKLASTWQPWDGVLGQQR